MIAIGRACRCGRWQSVTGFIVGRSGRQALESAVPPVKRSPQQRPARRLGEYRELIDEWLLGDLEAPRKQRHTAKRIWRRLVDEHGVEVAETTVRDTSVGGVAGSVTAREVFVPQLHAPGRTAEVDWGEADVDLAAARTRVHLFFISSGVEPPEEIFR